jgi:hypothetical protein
VGFPIRKSAGHRLLAPHRSLSQPITSFIASCRQGIHQMLFSYLTLVYTNDVVYRTKSVNIFIQLSYYFLYKNNRLQFQKNKFFNLLQGFVFLFFRRLVKTCYKRLPQYSQPLFSFFFIFFHVTASTHSAISLAIQFFQLEILL